MSPGFKEPSALLGGWGARWEPSFLVFSWDKLSGENRLGRGRFFA